MRVVVLTSHEAGNAARIIHYLCRAAPSSLEISGVIIDEWVKSSRSTQWNLLKSWYGRGGATYALSRPWRYGLRKPFPAEAATYHRTLDAVGREFGFSGYRVPNINDPESQAVPL